MKNVTITLDEATAAWARVRAAERGISLSRLVGEMLASHMQQDREYEEAMRHWLSKKPTKLRSSGERYPTRDEIHDRASFR